MALATNWQNNIGMTVDADFLNQVGTEVNAANDGLAAIFSGVRQAVVATSESTTSTTYANLATVTDSVDATVKASGMALVFLGATLSNSAIQASWMGFEVSGANTIAASDAKAIQFVSAGSGYQGSYGTWFLLTGLTPGLSTFKAKYRTTTGSGTATFSNRRIAVIPL